MPYKHRVSIAPMMDYTDRHFRYLLRLITKRALLYTEMITAEALLHGDRDFLLAYDPTEHPLALQLGGSDPKKLAQCTQMAYEYGYDEVNLNAGCPSDRVQSGRFGACLMKEPALVAECLTAMQAKVPIPVTLKTRIGVDEHDSYDHLQQFIATVAQAGCKTFIIHARKAWLQGLSPKENRTIPPLRYEVVYQLKKDFPQLNIVLNGGLITLPQMQTVLAEKVPHQDGASTVHLDGIMIGRQACKDPYFLAAVDALFYDATDTPLSRIEVAEHFLPYAETQLSTGVRLSALTRHLLGLFYGTPHARSWRRYLSEQAHKAGAGIEVIKEALHKI